MKSKIRSSFFGWIACSFLYFVILSLAVLFTKSTFVLSDWLQGWFWMTVGWVLLDVVMWGARRATYYFMVTRKLKR